MVVLDLGAGRGAQFDRDTYVSRKSRLRGRVARLVGCDVDPVVMSNPGLDEAHVIEPGKPLPFADASFDLVYSDWVLEHIEDPAGFAAEVDRILKPGGWFCARTPNKWGYVAMAARLSPDKVQSALLKMVQQNRLEHDVFPKYYRVNTLAALEQHFPPGRFLHASHTGNPEPAYHGGRVWMYRLIELFQGLPLRTFDTVIFAFLKKTDSNASAHAGRPKD
nr:class I SAM-dependent methyltransferase [Mesorhizobium sp. BR1-1-16]